jgi:hypothetical protein
VAELAHPGRDRQPAQAAASVHRLILLGANAAVGPELEDVISAWMAARLSPGAPLARCAVGCGTRFGPAQIVPAIGLLIGALDGGICVGGICSTCAARSEDQLFEAILRRLGGRELDLASLATSAGRA